MDHRFKWAALLVMVVVALAVGSVAYNAGVSHGVAMSASAQGAPAGTLPPVYYGYRPWGFGFGFGPFWFLLLWVLLLRGVCWGGGWRHRRWYRHDPYDAPPAFEDWHRRAHERMDGPVPKV
jgi:hypothetical protein